MSRVAAIQLRGSRLWRQGFNWGATLPARLRARLGWHHAALASILLLAGGLGFAQLGSEGYANTYYAASVKSMLTSWHNFYYAASDGQGAVALDKPPLGFWLQAISAKLLGFSGFSILLPEVLAGIAAVALLYWLVRRAFGPVAGLVSALVLALTPISVVTGRNNTVDSVLILLLLLAGWAAFRAAEAGQLRWLLLSAGLVGLGFNVKMLEAYLVVPAIALVYGLGAAHPWRTKARHLALATAVLLVVSLAWAISVDLTPAAQRPFVSDSGSNSELSLILGYNGIGRLASLFPQLTSLHLFGITLDLSIQPAVAPGIGDPGLFRLLSQTLGSQVSWLLPLAIAGLLVALSRLKRQFPLDQRGQAVIFWGGWLLVVGIYFSVSRFFHLYYLSLLAPAIAALAGIGLVELWAAYRQGSWRALILPATLLLTVFTQVHFLASAPDWQSWISPVIILTALAMAVALVALRLEWSQRVALATAVMSLGLAVLLVAPLAWTWVSVANGNGGSWLPQAGPSGTTLAFGPPSGGFPANPGRQRGFPTGNPGTGFNGGNGGGGFTGGFGGGRGGFGGGQGAYTYAGAQWNVLAPTLVTYLKTQQGQTKFLVATMTSSYASIFILAANAPALALGGYQGWDRVYTPTSLAQAVANNTIRFFYIPANLSSATQFGTTSLDATNNDLAQWVYAHCATVSVRAYQGVTSTGSFGGRGGNMQLYDCQAKP